MDAPAYHTHPEWRSFLAAIRAMPEDDLPRLVAADQLDEWGESERAELIRVQCHELYSRPCEQDRYPVESMPDLAIECLDYILANDDPQDRWCQQCKLRHRAMQLAELPPTIDENHRRHARRFNGNGWTAYLVESYVRGFVEDVRGPFSLWAQHAGRLEPEAVDLTVRLTDRPVMEYRIVPLPPSTPWHVATGLSQCRLVGCEWRDGHLDTEELLRLEYPWVSKWEVPPHRLYEGLVGHWHVNESGELVVTDLRRRGLDGNVSEDDPVQFNVTVEFDAPGDTP